MSDDDDEMTPQSRAHLARETRVTFQMVHWLELKGPLVDDEDEGDLPFTERFYAEWQRLHPVEVIPDEVSCENEEENDEYAWYCLGLTLDQLLALVINVIPEGFTAAVVPVSEGSLSGSQIAITKT